MNARQRQHLRAGLGFLAPQILGFLAFTIFPVILSVGLAFTNCDLRLHNMFKDASLQFVGWENFTRLFTHPDFWRFFGNTLFLMLGLPFAIAGSLGAALLLSGRTRGLAVYRTMFYLPHFTASVAIFLLWKKLFNPYGGPINQFLAALGFHPPEWLNDYYWAKPALMIMAFWTAVGSNNMLLYLAGLAQVPAELYEVADMDGASRWQKFWHVTWPQLAPVTFYIVIISVSGGFLGGFEMARTMTAGGPAGATTTLSYFLYAEGFDTGRLGYASAVAWVIFTLAFVMTLLNWKFGTRYVND